MLLLNMALCYLHQNFKRQNENRHFYIMQGLAFFQEYADARLAKAMSQGQQAVKDASMEIDFNRARIWNVLNLTNLAVEGYKKVLAASREDEMEDGVRPFHTKFDVNREAAYSLQTAYALSGDMAMARRITDKWLVL